MFNNFDKRNLALACFFAFMVMLMPSASFAQGATGFDFGARICALQACFLNNSVILLIATVAVIFLGIAAFFGKVNWGLVIVIGAGIIVIAGGSAIAGLFLGDGSACDDASSCADLGGGS